MQECDNLVEHFHTAGAIIVFAFGTIFTVIDAILTVLLPLRQQPNYRVVNIADKCCRRLRVILAVIALVNMIVGKLLVWFCFISRFLVYQLFIFCSTFDLGHFIFHVTVSLACSHSSCWYKKHWRSWKLEFNQLTFGFLIEPLIKQMLIFVLTFNTFKTKVFQPRWVLRQRCFSHDDARIVINSTIHYQNSVKSLEYNYNASHFIGLDWWWHRLMRIIMPKIVI